MFYGLVRPILFRLDAEDAHNRALAMAARLGRRPRLAGFVRRTIARPKDVPMSIAGLTFPNPIGLAAGMDKNALAPLAWWAFGFGFVELGTITPRAQAGKDRPRMFRFPDQRAIVNRMGFNNDGAEGVAGRLAEQKRLGLRPAFPIGLSLGKNATTPAEQAPEDYARAANLLAPHADYLAVNVSSPNTPGLRNLQSHTELARILDAIAAVSPGRPVFVKIAPELAESDLGPVIDTCGSHGVAGLIATNTKATLGQGGLPEGGLSGKPIHELSLCQVETVRRLAGDRLALIGCGGIDDAQSARAMLNAGANLVQLYTGLVYRGPFLPARLTRALARA